MFRSVLAVVVGFTVMAVVILLYQNAAGIYSWLVGLTFWYKAALWAACGLVMAIHAFATVLEPWGNGSLVGLILSYAWLMLWGPIGLGFYVIIRAANSEAVDRFAAEAGPLE